ncbi:MAG: LysE family translocator [Halobacteriales archaeon]|nr:LysE family translocator [Halobacteriales archaeon]
MVTGAVFLSFFPIALALILSPGPDSVYTLTRSISDGRTAGVMAALGTASGIVIHTTAVVLGLAALLTTSAVAVAVLKTLGAGYLVYLGVQTVRTHGDFTLSPDGGGYSPMESYRGAFVINVLNPKVAVFFLAFLPQFVRPGGSFTEQILVLGVVYAGLSFGYQGLLAVFSASARRVIMDRPLVQSAVRYASGSVLVAFGLSLALESDGLTADILG